MQQFNHAKYPVGYGEFKPLRDIAVPQFLIPENPYRRVTAYPGTIPAQPGTIPAESGEMTGELGPSQPKMEPKGRRIRSGTPPGRVGPNHRIMTRNRPEMEQKGRKMGAGTAPELPKSVRGASGAPPDDENAGQKNKPKKKEKKGPQKEVKHYMPHGIFTKKGSKKEVEIMKK